MNYFTIIMLFSLLITTSCENADLQKSLPKDDEKITTRTIECEDCPEEDCCCGVQLISSMGANLQLCGTSSPDNTTTTCSPIYAGSCTIQGYVLNLSLPNQYDIGLFCMPQNRAFCIQPTAAGTYRISCQAGVGGTQSIDVGIAANTPAYITVNENCEVSVCH